MNRLTVAYGYRSKEIKSLGEVKLWDDRVKILRMRYPYGPIQIPEMVSLGMHIEGVVLPHVDTRDPDTLRDGVCARMGKELPGRRGDFLAEISKTTKTWLLENFRPLAADSDFTFDTWIEGTNYDLARKNELREIYENVICPLERKGKNFKHFIVKLFAKDECYVDFKHARGIYARDDVAKVFFGPWFKLIENELYKNPTFIKHVPVKDRADYIYDRLYQEGNVYVQTDYSSYEAHFDSDLMANCEFLLYQHALENIPGSEIPLNVMREVLMGNNRVFNKYIDVIVRASRMSGEMNTSLGNGFSNYMLMYNQCKRLRLPCIGVVEGDDGLFTFPIHSKPATKDFDSCGCLIKLEVFSKISEASFCGLLFDEEDRQIVADIRKIMASLSWSSKQYVGASKNTHLALLRCKAMSMIVQYPSCPVVASMSRCVIRLTKHINTKKIIERGRFDLYTREKMLYGLNNYKHNLNAPVGLGTRILVEHLWGFSIELQVKLEEYFSRLESIQPVNSDEFIDLFPLSWRKYYDSFVVELVPGEDPNTEYIDRPVD